MPHIYQDADGGDYGEGMKERMYALAVSLSAPCIVEIGTRSGNSLRIWAAAVEATSGAVFSIDCVYRPDERGGPPWPIPARCVLFVASSHLLEWARPIDLLYIDGDHTTVGCQRDLEHWWPHVKSGGHVLLHDVMNEGHYLDLLLPVVHKWAREHQLTYTIWPNQCGMAHFVKP